MSIIDAHGLNPNEINKYESVNSIGYFSAAFYRSNPNFDPMKAFEHSHSEYEFLIPITTIHLIKMKNYRFIGEVGYCYPIEPNTNHGVDHALNKTHFCSIVISAKYMRKRMEALGKSDMHFTGRFPMNITLYYLLRDYRDSSRTENPSLGHLQDVAREITDILIKEGSLTKEKLFVPTRPYDPNIRKVLSYMYDNYKDPTINLTKLADYCGYSVAYFSRVFKQYVGDSPITHINKLRISEARSMFYNENLSLGDIATLVGFNNLSTFTEAFKKVTGEKPKMFRDRKYKEGI